LHCQIDFDRFDCVSLDEPFSKLGRHFDEAPSFKRFDGID